ncbi:Protein kinase C signaling pathway involved MAPKK protein [Apophysomyces ossiformis]|uniref:Protein kinase C signaling pathway involved MAPKK protein n=1 Tax=Apophysomyces ossiformis TaxID=679940 RepID=A0A8H7ESL4_9FUNG|nr:Protein kinase C signaling pathway involved MAPKK protein [Apophysomyces ossiformis]
MTLAAKPNKPSLKVDVSPALIPSDGSNLSPSSELGPDLRENLERIVSQNRSQSFLPEPETENGEEGDHHVDLKPEDFENIHKLGEGAAGAVWKVRYKPTGKIMARKTITIEAEPKLQRQILRELSILQTCRSPHIVAYYGSFLDDGGRTVAICMEYCEGGSLEDIYKRARDMGGVIGEAVLAKIAESHVIHRDVKPSNILMTRNGEIKLCDLGVSGELINSIAETFTGTQYYMAPERIQGAPYSVQSDIWSLGLSIIEIAQNRPVLPPPGHPPMAVFELLEFIVKQPLPNLGEDRSRECRDFVAKCLFKDPKERPGPEKMLEHPFIKTQVVPAPDLASWLKQVWGWP